MKKLVVSLKDIQGVPHGSQFSFTNVRVVARYTSEIVLTDGTIVPHAVVDKPLPTGGSVSFDVWASDDPAVKAEYRDFAIRVDVQVSPSRGTSRKGGYTKTAKVLMSSPSPVQFGSLPSAEGLPPKWTSVADFRDEFQALVVEGQALVAQNADTLTAAQQAEANAAASAQIAQQSQALQLEIPDEVTEALVGNSATLTHAALKAPTSPVVAKGSLVVNVKDYGAKGDDATDDTAAIAAAVTAAKTAGPHATLFFPPATGYRTTTTTTITGSVGLAMEGAIHYAGTGTALVLGGNTTGENPSNVKQFIRVRNVGTRNWNTESSIGVKLVGHSYSELTVMMSRNFTIGVKCVGDGNGFAYNKINLGQIWDNKYGVDLDAINVGWVNENSFFGGSFRVGTTSEVDKDRFGVRITSSDLTYVNNNSNVFYHPSFEIRNPGPGVGTCVLVEHGGVGNRFLDCRHESPGATAVITKNAALPPLFTTAYNTAVLDYDDQGDYAGTVIKEAARWAPQTAKRLVFDSGELHKSACYYDGSGMRVNVPRVGSLVSTHTAIRRYGNTSGLVVLGADSVSIAPSGMLGVYMSTRAVKEFVLAVDSVGGNGGRLVVHCLNSSGALVSTPGAVKSDSTLMQYLSSFMGSFRTGSDSSVGRYFKVSDEVDSVFVGVSGGGSANALLRSFAIYSMSSGGAASWWLPWNDDGVNVGTAPPTSGTWDRGRRILHAEPGPGKPQGWVCTTAGMPGTWTAMPNL